MPRAIGPPEQHRHQAELRQQQIAVAVYKLFRFRGMEMIKKSFLTPSGETERISGDRHRLLTPRCLARWRHPRAVVLFTPD